MDEVLTRTINNLSHQSGAIDTFMLVVTDLGPSLMVAAVVALWWLGGERLSARHTCLAIAGACAGSLLLNQAIVLFIHRTRPYDAGVTHLETVPSADWSFPSDHATAAASIVIGLWLFQYRRLALSLAALAALVMLSRVWLGLHYVGDIAGGVATAGAAAATMRRFYDPVNRLSQFLVKLL